MTKAEVSVLIDGHKQVNILNLIEQKTIKRVVHKPLPRPLSILIGSYFSPLTMIGSYIAQGVWAESGRQQEKCEEKIEMILIR